MSDTVKRIAILGSTGSIGCQALEVVRRFPGSFRAVALVCGQNAGMLMEQVREFKPRLAGAAGPLPDLPPGTSAANVEDIVTAEDVDLVLVATAGLAGLKPTLAALRAGKQVALANKEVLVAAGDLVMGEAHRREAVVRPVDSEHSAVWQCLAGELPARIKAVWLTASGGPFYGRSAAELREVTADRALQHPTWQMGRKVTIDSATLMNKGLEIIEAHHLFSLPFNQLKVVVHRQSIIHALVEFTDGAVKAQLASPDMRLPIQYAFTWPDRLDQGLAATLDLARSGMLTFESPDEGRFPCLGLAREAGARGGSWPAALCGADEMAVQLFLEGRVGFTEIPVIVDKTLQAHRGVSQPGLEEIFAAEKWGRLTALHYSREGNRCQ
jgi:1-deoxy-D-xylulose-5-phosphate reductoisomerase